MDEPSGSHKSGVGRSKSGCQTCRARKVRCDERAGVCQNCERLGLPCTTGAGTEKSTTSATSRSVASPATAGVKRKRTFRSCIGCRASKTRCSGDKPICVRCKERSLECDYEDDSEPAWKQQLRLTGASHAETNRSSTFSQSDVTRQATRETTQLDDNHDGTGIQSANDFWGLWSQYLPSIDKIRTLVEYYFVNVHPLRCFGFLHKPSFMRRLDSGDTDCRDDALLHIVCALGALFMAAENESQTSAHTIDAGSQWAKTAQQLILSQLGDIAVENLMAAVLLHDYELRMGNFGNAFMLSGLM